MSLIGWPPLGAYAYIICNGFLLNIVLCIGEKHEEAAAGWDGQSSSHEKWCSSFHFWIWWSCFKNKNGSSPEFCRNCRSNRSQEYVLDPWYSAIFENYLKHSEYRLFMEIEETSFDFLTCPWGISWFAPC